MPVGSFDVRLSPPVDLAVQEGSRTSRGLHVCPTTESAAEAEAPCTAGASPGEAVHEPTETEGPEMTEPSQQPDVVLGLSITAEAEVTHADTHADDHGDDEEVEGDS